LTVSRIQDLAPLAAGLYLAGMVRRRKRRTDRLAEAESRPEDGPVDDAGSLVKLAGDQAASGLPQGLSSVFIVYALFRVIRGLVRFLRGGPRT
jgi:hypothetical protein